MTMQSREERIAEIKSIIRAGDEFQIPGHSGCGRKHGFITQINRTWFVYEIRTSEIPSDSKRFRIYNIEQKRERIDALHGTGSRITHDGVNIIQLP